MVEARVGRGTWVSDAVMDGANPPQPLAWQTLFSSAAERLRDPAMRDLLATIGRPGTIGFGAGAPAPEFFPVDLFRRAMDEALDTHGPDLFVYGAVQGWLPLREALVEWMARGGIRTTAEQVVVLHGSQQGLDLVARVLLEPGDAVVVESPTYLGALQVFRGAGARLLPVALDQDGMRIDLLEQVLARHRPKFIYTLPTYQNPTGVTMPLARRHALLALAARHGVPIVEDDPYGELHYGDEPPPRLAALDRRGLVIYLSTMSKLFLPGLRLGWLAAPPPIVEAVTLARQNMRCPPEQRDAAHPPHLPVARLARGARCRPAPRLSVAAGRDARRARPAGARRDDVVRAGGRLLHLVPPARRDAGAHAGRRSGARGRLLRRR